MEQFHPDHASRHQQNYHDKYLYSVDILLMSDSGPVQNTWRTLSNKFEKQCISLAFIIRTCFLLMCKQTHTSFIVQWNLLQQNSKLNSEHNWVVTLVFLCPLNGHWAVSQLLSDWPLLCDELPRWAALASAAQKQRVWTENYKWQTARL